MKISMDKKNCWIIAGATSAIAMRFAHEVAAQDHQIILLGRNREKLVAIQADLQIRYSIIVDYLLFDALTVDEHENIAKNCAALAKAPIQLYVAFGVMFPGIASDQSMSQSVQTVHSNFTAVVSIIYAFLPFFKHQKEGHIVILGSVAGDRGRASNLVYGAAKAALIPFCEGLRAALLPYSVSVTLMKLGFIDTRLTFGKPGVFLVASPEDCARACLKAAYNKKYEKYFPWFWRWIMLIFKWMPRCVLYRLKV